MRPNAEEHIDWKRTVHFCVFLLLCLFYCICPFYFYTFGTKGHVSWIFCDHWQQFYVANKTFTAAILSLTIFFYCTFYKVKMTHSLLDSILPKMHIFNTQPKIRYRVGFAVF